MTTPPNPYDPDAALEAIRPRLAGVRRRRRRALRGSAAMATTAVVALALTTGMGSDDGSTAVLAGSTSDSHLEELLDAERSATSTPSSTAQDARASTTTAVAVDDSPPETLAPQHTDPTPPPQDKPAPPPPPPPPEPKPAPPPAPEPVAQRHTFQYDRTGSLVVEHEGQSLTLVSATAQAGWTAHPHQGHDYVKVEFRKGDISRWLKVRLENGVPTVHRWEERRSPECDPPVGATTHAAPLEAGAIEVTVRSDGTLKLGTVTEAPGWQHEIHIANHDTVKVKFWNAELGEVSWVKVLLRDCEIEVETGT